MLSEAKSGSAGIGEKKISRAEPGREPGPDPGLGDVGGAVVIGTDAVC